MAFKEEGQARFPFFYQATVLRNDDPEKCGRIRAHVPAIKTETAWALPIGGAGCGPQRGLFAVPPVESNVIVGFIQGDIDMPFYMCGPWGAAKGTSEVPRAASSEPEGTVHRVHAFESDLFEIFINDEKKKLVIRTKDLQEEIEMDANDRSIRLKARNWLILEAGAISIDAPGGVVQVAGRKVARTSEPI